MMQFTQKPCNQDPRLAASPAASIVFSLFPNQRLLDGGDIAQLFDGRGKLALIRAIMVDDRLVLLGLELDRFYPGNGFESLFDMRRIGGARKLRDFQASGVHGAEKLTVIGSNGFLQA
jgi:hypothetical protein